MLSIYFVIEFSKLYVIISSLLKTKKEKVIRRPIYMSLFFLTLLVDVLFFVRSGFSWNHITESYVYMMLLIAVLLSFLLIGYIVASIRSLLLFVFIQCITLLFDAFIVLLIVSTSGVSYATLFDQPLLVFFLPLSSLLFVLFLYLLRRKKLTEHISLIRTPKELALILLGVIGFGFYLHTIYVSIEHSYRADHNPGFIIATIGGVLLLLLFVFLYVRNNKLEQLEREKQALDTIVKLQENYYNDILTRDIETRRFRHDMVNHMQALKGLTINNKYTELNSYLSEFANTLVDIIPAQTIETGSTIINALLMKLMNEFQEYEVTLQWRGMILGTHSLTQNDLTSIFSNLLTNAYEAASKCTDDRIVQVSVDTREHIYIQISNTYVEEYISGQTTKVDTLNHGYGLTIVQNIVDKYDGVFEIKTQDDFFVAEISII